MEKFEIEFETYTEEYSANSFYEHYKDNLPQMVMVTQGYLGEDGFETFDSGQVFRIQAYSSQKRVMALVVSGEKGTYSLQGRHISIPVDYDVKCNVIKDGKPKSGKPASLKEIIKHNDLPLDVQFAGNGDQSMVNIGGSERTSSLFTLILLHTYEDIYLLGNEICYGNLYNTITAVPAYLPDLRFSIVKSFKGLSEELFTHFLNVTGKYVNENLQFNPTFGNSDIALYSQDKTEENERLSFISPCEIFDLKDILRNNKTKPAKRSQKETEDTYEVIRTSTIAKYQSINQSTIGSETNRTYDSNNIETKDVSNNSYKEEIEHVGKSLRPINIDKKGNGDSKSEKTEKKEDVEQLTKGKSEEEAEMKRYLPSLSKKTDPSVTKRTQPSDSRIVPVDVSDDRHKIGSVNVGRASSLPVKRVEPVKRKSGEADAVVDVKSLTMEDYESIC